MNDELLEELAEQIIALLRGLSSEGRLHVLALLKDEFCESCGRNHGGERRCQCWNDE